jgi:hypothetical protein
MSRFKTVAPVMIYMEPKELSALKKYAKERKLTVSSVAREGVRMRLSGNDDPYNSGFNDGLNMAMKITSGTQGAQMMFPSGKSFSALVCEEISKYLRERAEEKL